MTSHETKSGTVSLLRKWGHGKGYRPNPRTPATLTIDDGDGHYEVWRYTGKLTDALECLATLERAVYNGTHVAVRAGAGYVLTPTPPDFWITDESGGSEPNFAKYPDVIGY